MLSDIIVKISELGKDFLFKKKITAVCLVKAENLYW